MYLIKTSQGYKKFSGIQRLRKESLKITFANLSEPIVASVDQLFWNFTKWVRADELRTGDILQNTIVQQAPIENIEQLGEIYVYDILNSEVGHFETSGFIAHNCSFIGSAKTLIRADLLENLIEKQPIELKLEYKFKIFFNPAENHKYILGVDPAEGTGNDFSVIQVLDITNPLKIFQVGTYSDNKIDPYKFADLVVAISELYNNSLIVVESNSVGILVTNRIWRDLNCDRLINISENGKGLGIKATKKSKKMANMIFKRFVEQEWFIIYNKDTISELGKYEEQTNGSYKVLEPDHDDQITSLIYIFYYLESSYNESSGAYESFEIDEQIKKDLGSFTPISVSSSDVNEDQSYNYDNYNDNGSDLDYLNYI